MRGNTFGKLLSITSFGESHGPAMGVIVDGVPGNLTFDLDALQNDLNRRAPGRVKGTTARKEEDKAIIMSGVFNHKTLGSPIMVMVNNTNQRSEDYKKIKNDPRPGHGDQTYIDKFGISDHRGGGRSSGRETLARVIGGYFSKLIIPEVKVSAFTRQMGELHAVEGKELKAPYYLPGIENKQIENYLMKLKSDGDSCGGVVEVSINDCPKGLGEPCFDKLKAELGKAILSIGACVGFSYGEGEKLSLMRGKEATLCRSNFGGIEGGISNGEAIKLQVFVKPTSTVGEKAKEGRHDPCIIPRMIPVIESMIYLTLADHYLRQRAYQI
jgi:chorismate synthase